MYAIRCYYWNPNGTNDIEIVNSQTGEVVDCIQEALFGVNLSHDFKFISLKTALKSIAASPVNDGRGTVRTLAKYFKH